MSPSIRSEQNIPRGERSAWRTHGAGPERAGAAGIGTRNGVPRGTLAAALVFLLGGGVAGAQSTTSGHRLEVTALDAAGAEAGTSGHGVTTSLAQDPVVGTSASPRYVLRVGLWGFFASGLAPVILMASHSPGNPEAVELSWTGDNPPYHVFRADSCAAVYQGLLAVQTAKDLTDAPPQATLTCYSVLATAPGP